MAKDTGWIKLHRTSFDNELYFKQKFTEWQAWCDLLLLANHKDGYFEKRGIRILIPRGCVGYSSRVLGKRWKWGYKKVLNFIRFLEGKIDPQIRTHKSNLTTIISILNYDKYQIGSPTERDTLRPTDVPQTSLNKNDKEYFLVKQSEKNEKKESVRGLSAGEALYVGRYGSSLPEPVGNKKDDSGSKGNG